MPEHTQNTGRTDVVADPQPDGTQDYNPGADPELRRQIEEALDVIRPYLMADGGSVRLLNITPDLVVELELLGACGSCPMSTMTLRAGIEQALKRSVPQVARVEAVNAPAPY
jgi:Fe-S cluster biogenesis protein NfuA